MRWAQKNLANLTAAYVPGVLNVQADFLSQVHLDNNEWALHEDVFQWVLSLGFSSVSEETQMGGSRGVGNNSALAQQALVSSPIPPQFSGPSSSPIQTGPALPRLDSPSMSGSPSVEGLVLERGRLEALGCPKEPISTLLSARRRSTNKVYEWIWAKFVPCMSSRTSSYVSPAVQDVLGFLQSGLDLLLSVSSLRVQVSAISTFTGVSWAKHALIQQFFKGAVRLRPQRKPRFPKWDLPLVLDFFSHFNKALSIRELTLKTAFLVAVTSAKRVSEIQVLGVKEPFLTFFPGQGGPSSNHGVKP
ncbi:uncharacterized protein LOC143930391 [Lithobates pipiens]